MSFHIFLASKYFLAIIHRAGVGWSYSLMNSLDVIVDCSAFELLPALIAFHPQVGVDALRVLEQVVAGGEPSAAQLAHEVPHLVVHQADVILDVDDRLPALLIRTWSLDHPEVVFRVCGLDVLDQAAHPLVAVGAQLHPLQLHSALELLSFLLLNPPDARDQGFGGAIGTVGDTAAFLCYISFFKLRGSIYVSHALLVSIPTISSANEKLNLNATRMDDGKMIMISLQFPVGLNRDDTA